MNSQTDNNSRTDKILKTKPGPLIVSGLIVIALFFGGLIVWSIFFPFSGAVIAPGQVKVSQEKKTVQHLEGGIVDEILVDEGDHVQKGQPLIKLKSEQVHSAVDMLQGRLWSKLAQAARLRAESDRSEKIEWPRELLQKKDNPDVKKVMEKEKNIFKTRRKDLQGKISRTRSQIEQLKNKISGLKEELSAQKDIIRTLQEEITAKENLFQDKYINKAKLLELQRKLATRRGRRGSLKQSIAESKKKIEELRLEIVNLRNKYREKAVTELGKVTDTIFEVRERLRPKLDAQARLTIEAPMAGEVMNLRVHSEDSGVIKAGEPLLDIVPKEAKLIIEARVKPSQITDVEVGQTTNVQLSAFNRRTTPPVPGEVTYVSADQVTRKTSQGEQSFYQVYVDIEKEQLDEVGAYLSPGMPAVSYITTQQRTILEYLLAPILKVVDQAMREPS